MKFVLISWIMALLCFFVFFIVQTLVLLVFNPQSRFAAQKKVFFLLLPILMWVAWKQSDFVLFTDWTTWGFWGLTVSLLLVTAFFFMAFYAAVEHSVRIRIAVEIYKMNRKMSFEELKQVYKPEEATRHRIHQLLTGGYLIQKKQGEMFELTEKGKLFAAIGWWGKKIFRIGIGG